VTVVSGSIRPPDDDDALSVKISIWDTEVTMRANGSELGNWPTNAVGIRSLDAKSFEFIAEGDHLIFTPDDPEEFRRHPLVRGVKGEGRKKRRKRERKVDPGPPELAWHEESAEETRRRNQRPKAQPQPEVKPEPRRLNRRERKAAPAAGGRVVKDVEAEALDSRTPGVSTVVEVPDFTQPAEAAMPSRLAEPAAEPRPAKKAKVAKVKAAKPGAPAKALKPAKVARQRPERTPVGERFSGLKERRHAVWLFTLDQARKYDLFGLDRVPVNESMRGREHQHTWEHRVAPQTGPGSYICTICGTRRRTH
jgi:hypothetical protein